MNLFGLFLCEKFSWGLAYLTILFSLRPTDLRQENRYIFSENTGEIWIGSTIYDLWWGGICI